ADLLALGWWAGAGLGPYAAARRVVFAMAALGLVVPSALGPMIAAAWVSGVPPARAQVRAALARLWSLSLPAAVGLALTAAGRPRDARPVRARLPRRRPAAGARRRAAALAARGRLRAGGAGGLPPGGPGSEARAGPVGRGGGADPGRRGGGGTVGRGVGGPG